MFCPKCGSKNPDNGKFCRSCGTDLNAISDALTGKPNVNRALVLKDKKGKAISWESAFGKLFTGLAFIGVTIALANSAMGRDWWFWMLIPALGCIGSGLAQIFQIKSNEKLNASFIPTRNAELSFDEKVGLPPNQTNYIPPLINSEYKTGDLVPPSIVENTTRRLEMDSEGETINLPKSNL